VKTFLVVETQDGGCDYTIGCGVRHYTMEAESYTALLEEVREVLRTYDEDHGLHSELAGSLGETHPEYLRSSVEVYEIASSHWVDLREFRQIVVDKRNADAAEKVEASERAELERLKAKYG